MSITSITPSESSGAEASSAEIASNVQGGGSSSLIDEHSRAVTLIKGRSSLIARAMLASRVNALIARATMRTRSAVRGRSSTVASWQYAPIVTTTSYNSSKAEMPEEVPVEDPEA